MTRLFDVSPLIAMAVLMNGAAIVMVASCFIYDTASTDEFASDAVPIVVWNACGEATAPVRTPEICTVRLCPAASVPKRNDEPCIGMDDEVIENPVGNAHERTTFASFAVEFERAVSVSVSGWLEIVSVGALIETESGAVEMPSA